MLAFPMCSTMSLKFSLTCAQPCLQSSGLTSAQPFVWIWFDACSSMLCPCSRRVQCPVVRFEVCGQPILNLKDRFPLQCKRVFTGCIVWAAYLAFSWLWVVPVSWPVVLPCLRCVVQFSGLHPLSVVFVGFLAWFPFPLASGARRGRRRGQ